MTHVIFRPDDAGHARRQAIEPAVHLVLIAPGEDEDDLHRLVRMARREHAGWEGCLDHLASEVDGQSPHRLPPIPEPGAAVLELLDEIADERLESRAATDSLEQPGCSAWRGPGGHDLVPAGLARPCQSASRARCVSRIWRLPPRR